MQFLGVFFILIGGGMVAMSPYMATKKDAGDAYLRERVPPAVVANVDFEFNRLPLVQSPENDRTRGFGV
jgi:hypothetical protein